METSVAIPIFGILFVTLVTLAALAIPVLVLVIILKAVTSSKRNAGLQEDEARIMQEIYQSLGRMEERIEALETLVLDPKDKVSVEE
ncbi:MAG: envelope stress response membrane protein PspB [Candidatus Hydrogenedentes bacterium]|nr:envelope stress response membrane protein PspB [Candidatus Hydrogenedentota bacterium]